MSASEEYVSIMNPAYKIPSGMGMLQVVIQGQKATIHIELPEKKELHVMEIEYESRYHFFSHPDLMCYGRVFELELSGSRFSRLRNTADTWFECLASIDQLERFESSFSSYFDKSKYSMCDILHAGFDSMSITPEYHIRKTSGAQEEMEHTSMHQI